MSIDHVVLLISHWLMHVPSFDCFLPIVNFLCIILYASEFAPKCNQNAPLSVSLLEGVKIVDGVSEGEYNGELEINMTSLTQNNTYSVALEWYQKDQWLFNHSQFSADGTGSEIHNVTVPTHTHEQNKTHLIYHHTLTIQFRRSVRGNASLNK